MSRGTWELSPGRVIFFAYWAVTLYGRPFQIVQLKITFFTSRQDRGPAQPSPTTPERQRPRAITSFWFGLLPFRSPLLRESHLLSFPRGTKMFQFPRYTSAHPKGHANFSFGEMFHIRRSPAQNLRAVPRSLSQLATSFITA